MAEKSSDYKLVKIFIFIIILSGISFFTINAQYTTHNAHSHNDYANDIPFRLAYNNHFGSIEPDIWAVNGDLYVAHNEKDIKPEKTLDILYIQPIINAFKENKGKPWSDRSSTFQLLIDLKTAVEPTLSLLVEKLRKYPNVFDPKINQFAVRVVITGNRPAPETFGQYPDFICFDGLLKQQYNADQLKRIALYSENIRQFSLWYGEGEIVEKEKIRLNQVIDSVHSIGKKIRFWNTPDNSNAWETFMKMHIDYLNTDHIIQLSEYLNTRGKLKQKSIF